MHRFSFHRRLLPTVLLAAIVVLVFTALAGIKVPAAYAQSTAQRAPAPRASQGPCTAAFCTFQLQVNPGLLAGKPFACPAIQQARASITITNRFAIHTQNDLMSLTASGLPPNTGFDLFLVQNSPLDAGFTGFGFGWYQSDVQSDSRGLASVRVQGIFDKETFIENPANQFVPIHTFNVGFWFNSPTEEQKVCGNKTTPPTTPFNGEQNAGLLAMITQGEPLQFVE
jgi:hypothetical protein